DDFICDGFSGLCSYRITDVSGRILKEGKTSCGSRNAIGNYKLGIYVIQVYDEAGNMLSRKILVSE
ncbi:MAG: T9SS type A sorting domain-containing protein, partial [Bacteroidales bacterium]|nr:T9SS type A sorting domain-containing protein [Bacteroidales bacterium]